MTRLILLLLLCSMSASLFAQDEPQDLLPADFHLGRREALRKILPPKGVAVFFANPVRNRSNDVDYLYHQNDPKQADKNMVKAEWDVWQTRPNMYKSNASFARAMLEKYPRLESQKVIAERWCKEWGK